MKEFKAGYLSANFAKSSPRGIAAPEAAAQQKSFAAPALVNKGLTH